MGHFALCGRTQGFLSQKAGWAYSPTAGRRSKTNGGRVHPPYALNRKACSGLCRTACPEGLEGACPGFACPEHVEGAWPEVLEGSKGHRKFLAKTARNGTAMVYKSIVVRTAIVNTKKYIFI
jgi:hypothetical protein